MKKTLSRVIIALICVLFLFAGCTAPVIETESTTQLITETTTEESTAVADDNLGIEQSVTDEMLETVGDVAVIVEHGGDIASDEIVPQKEADEEKLEDDSINKNEEGIEPDASVEQENISYDGVVKITDGKSLISGPPALTYYSQAESTRTLNISGFTVMTRRRRRLQINRLKRLLNRIQRKLTIQGMLLLRCIP